MNKKNACSCIFALSHYFILSPFFSASPSSSEVYARDISGSIHKTIILKDVVKQHISVPSDSEVRPDEGFGIDIRSPVFLENSGLVSSLRTHAIRVDQGGHDSTIHNKGTIYGEDSGIFGENGVLLSVKNSCSSRKKRFFEKNNIFGKRSAITVSDLYLENAGVIRSDDQLGTVTVTHAVGSQGPKNSKTPSILKNSGTIENTGSGPSVVFQGGQNTLELGTGSKIIGPITGHQAGAGVRSRHNVTLFGSGDLSLAPIQGFDTMEVRASPEGWRIARAEVRENIQLSFGVLIVSDCLGAPADQPHPDKKPVITIMPNASLIGNAGTEVLIRGNIINRGGNISGSRGESGSSGGLMTISGRYVGQAGSTYTARIFGNDYERAASDRLTVLSGGDFSLTDVEVILNLRNHPDLIRGKNTYHLIDGADSGRFGRVREMNYAFFNQPDIDASGMLTLSFKNREHPFVISNLKRTEQLMAVHLSQAYEKVLSDPFATHSKVDFLNQILSSSQEQAKVLLNAGNPQIYGDAALYALSHASRLSDQVCDQFDGRSGYEVRGGGQATRGWAQIWRSKTTIYGGKETDDAHQSSCGFNVGLEKNWFGRPAVSRVAASAFLTSARVARIGQIGNFRGEQAALYQDYETSKHLRLSALVGYTHLHGDTARPTVSSSGGRNVLGKVSSHVYYATLRADFPLRCSAKYFWRPLDVIPTARVDAFVLGQNGICENRDDPGHMDISPITHRLVSTYLGVELRRSMIGSQLRILSPLEVVASLGWEHKLPLKRVRVRYTLPGFGLTDRTNEVVSALSNEGSDVARGRLAIAYRIPGESALAEFSTQILANFRSVGYLLSLGASISI